MSSVLRIGSLVTLTAASLSAHATNGYFTHGTSVRAQGMAGVTYAMAHDSLSAASNPAALSALQSEQQLDLGVTYFKPERKSTITGNGLGIDGSYDGNDTEAFWMPELGYAYKYSDVFTFGLALYGNGGMNTDYGNNPFANFGSSGSLGVNLEQLFVTGTLAIRLNDRNSVGLGATWTRQTFEAKGVQAFAGMSQQPGKVSNNGTDVSTGWGVKLGWQGQLTDSLTAGLSWSSRIQTSAFEKYSGLFAEQGGFDIPANYGAGLAWQALDGLTLAADWQYIEYSSVAAVGNELSMTSPMGSDEGAGFGWNDINVYKLGVQYALTSSLTLRAGYSYADQPIPTSQTFLNILAPGVIQKHASLGGSWDINDSNSVSLAYTHGFEETVKGKNSIPANFGGGEADITMFQNQLAVAWQLKF
ncbi:OmpP1/FadL family transporter [Oceanobacter mangrovi]|uniref:OmpP1/FadL family transporter n=1 Tax=Oceanobacter mangrovi TaxID=2862510 RepID=UPI001C8D5CD2|nr:outer membrane protein transport protein [Oceanobacter mangrovi]